MLLQLSTWPEVDAYLQRSQGIILPIGSTEQHGPNGLIGTDAICPETIARGMAEQIDVLVAPTINFGMAQHHMAFPGTVSLRPSTLLAVVRDIVGSLSRHGFTRCYFLNGHGGNSATVNAAFADIYADAGSGALDVRCKLVNWWQIPAIARLAQELFGNAEGRHATPSEVSLSFFAHPDAVKNADMAPRVAPEGEIFDATDFRRRFPDGRIGSDPSLASVAAGEQLFSAAVAELVRDYQAFVTA